MPVTVGTGQLTLTDLNDALVSGSQPANPTNGAVWIDESVSPKLIKRWNGTGWLVIGEIADEGTGTTIDGIETTLANFAADDKITRFERGTVRQAIFDITGTYINGNLAAPSLATMDVDTYNKGSLFSLRKAARAIGVSTAAGSAYATLGTNYTSLAAYLNNLSPKPWDTTVDTVLTIDKAVWEARWSGFYTQFALLQVAVQDRQKALSDAAQTGAVAQVSNSVSKATVPITNPMSITAPVASLGLPEFTGKHIDSWTWKGRNLIKNSGLVTDSTGWGLVAGVTRDANFANDGYPSFQYNVTGLSTDGWRSATPTNITISAGQALSASAEVYIPTGHGIDVGSPTLEIQIYNSAGTRIGTSIQAVGLTTLDQWVRVTKANYVVPTGGVSANARVWIQRNGKCYVSKVKLELSATANVWTPAPEDVWGSTIPERYQPISFPTFSSGTDLTMNVKLYGDGTYNDTLAWNDKGQAIKTKQWDDISLSDKQGWAFHLDGTGYKQVKAAGFSSGGVADGTVVGVKFDGTPLTSVTTVNAANQVRLVNADNTLFLSLADSETGWGETYTPTPEEIKAFLLGWKMCNGTYNTNYTAKKEVIKLTISAAAAAAGNISLTLNGSPYTIAVTAGMTTSAIATKIATGTYTGYTVSAATNVVTFTAIDNPVPTTPSYSPDTTGANGTIAVTTVGDVKVWHPIGDTNLNRATIRGAAAPTNVSATMLAKQIAPYQVLFRMTDTFAEEVSFDGILILIQGANQISISYPDFTPEISTGTIKYATNLATVNEDTRYLLPTIQKRLVNAEEKITDDSITHTVTNSVEYQVAMSSKANASALSGLATRDELDGVTGKVDELGNAVNNIDLTPYVTSADLIQTSKDITAQFSATGGMNLIKNSIGFSSLDFWTDYTANKVLTVSDATLDNLGFGSGFRFLANGSNKGIVQTISVNSGQPYTLSWYINKMTSGADNSYRFWVQIMENGVVTQQIEDNSNTKTTGYEHFYMNYTPSSTSITVRFIGYANVEAILTGTMLTIGNVPLQWTLATGEVYNTNIRLNLNGIRVSQLDANRKEVGYTLISPDEFAGYFSPNNNGVFEKIFYLNGDETVTKKLRATEEITMGSVKVLKIETSASKGWAFVPNTTS
jgi:hypothetical protein